VTIPLPSFQLIFEGRLKPADLPAREAVPVALNSSWRIESTETRYSPVPPVLRKVQLEGDRHLRLTTRGIPACGRRDLPKIPPPSERCADALVGRGEVVVEFHYPENRPIEVISELAVYNGGVRNGVTKLWVYSYVNPPLDRAIVVPVKVRKVKRDRYGWEAVASVPVLGEGYGSVLSFNLTLQKRVLSARCPRGSLGARLTTSFSEETVVSGSLIRSCNRSS
jgi:hypothetical protein